MTMGEGGVTVPGVTRAGLALLYRARIHQRRHGRPYRLQDCDGDRRGVASAIRGGYASRLPGDPEAVTLTAKGEAYLDLLMRSE